MKTLSLVILTLLALYNPKVEAEVTIHPMERAFEDLDNISLVKRDPLQDIDENLESYKELVKIFKEFQTYNLTLSTKLLDKVQNHNTLSGDDLYLIKRTFEIYFKLNSKMLDFGTLYQFSELSMAKTLSDTNIKLQMVKAHLIWLSSNALVMEHMEAIHKVLYATDGAFRRIFKTTIAESALSLTDKENIKKLASQMNRVTEIVESLKFSQQINLIRGLAPDIKLLLSEEPNALVILREITDNKIANDIARGRRDFKLPIMSTWDSVIGFFNKVSNSLSGIFGNIAGSIQWRKGHLFDNGPANKIAKNTLRPMDIILEKSPFVLTDKFIPGHFGHVAIYLGTKEQLESIGMWNHPSLIRYQKSIMAGKTILEAVRPGVRLNTVDAFMNIDEMSIVRKIDGLNSSAQIAEQITRGIDQIGKAYDFNFDITTLDKIVCSELIYIVFGHVHWMTAYRVGRPTISPDDIAEMLFQKNTRFKMIDNIFANKRNTLNHGNLTNLAPELDYELRSENGEVIKDPNDSTNSYWKKQTKCYNVNTASNGLHNRSNQATRACKTTYKEYYYEEAGI